MRIQGLEKNIYMELKLSNLKLQKSLYESIIVFELFINIENESYIFKDDLNMTFTQYELLNLMKKLNRSLENFFKNEKFESITFNSSEAYFELHIRYGGAFDEIEIEIWLNLASLTNGKIVGYDKGYRFASNIEKIKEFSDSLKKDYYSILG